MKSLNQDKIVALFFLLLTITFLVVSMTNESFFDWVFDRHHNLWSWYIRPLFLIPFCYFAYRHSWSGVSITIFCLFTSMFWFNRPEIVSDRVNSFLQFEKDWLYGEWNEQKILMMIMVPVSFSALGIAFWKRSLFIGLAVIVLMATGKIVWSIYHGGESGKSLVLPALFGLTCCIVMIGYGFNKLEKRHNPNR